MKDATDVTEFERFARCLAVYATSWIESRQNEIVAHAREMFEDRALRMMVETYAEEKAASEKTSRYEFVKACLGEDIAEVGESSQDVHTARVGAYFKVLNDIVFKTYLKG